MTDLYLALTAVGAVIIAAVIVFNWWQERRIRQETIRRFDGPIDDVLMASLNQGSGDAHEASPTGDRLLRRVEPTIGIEPVSAGIGVSSGNKTTDATPGGDEADIGEEYSLPPFDDPMLEKTAPIPIATQEQAAETVVPEPAPVISTAGVGGELPVGIDEKIDLIAMIVPAQPCNGEKLREALLPLPQLGKPNQWLGLNADGAWCQLARDQEQAIFSRIVGTLQLADRSGAVSGSTLRSFQLKAEEAAKRLAADLEWRDQVDPRHYAQELDKFSMEVDVMVGLHLISAQGGPFAGTKLRGLAEAGGMALHDDGTFHYVNETDETLFTLVDQEHRPFSAEMLRTALIHAVTLQLDVPRVKNFPEAFNRMMLLARRMEQGLNAKLVDDNQRVLGDAEIEKIRQQLKVIHGIMTARAIMPGSPTALRLFS